MTYGALIVSFLVGQTATPATDGRIVLARGEVTIRTAENSVTAQPGAYVHQGDQVRTGRDSGVRLLLGGSAVVDLGANTSMVVTRAGNSSSETRLKLFTGRLWARVSSLFGSTKFEVDSPNAVAGVRGTEFIMDVAEDGGTQVTVLQGSVAVTASEGGPSQLIEVGGTVSTKDGKTLTTGTASESERRGLRSSASSGGRLNAQSAQARFSTISPQLPSATTTTTVTHQPQLPQLPQVDSRQGIPPIDLDPASGRSRLRGIIQLVN